MTLAVAANSIKLQPKIIFKEVQMPRPDCSQFYEGLTPEERMDRWRRTADVCPVVFPIKSQS